jgi:DNA adenine methylase
MSKTKPLLKWVGGKTQIMDELMGRFPLKINNYHEPFLGGGSVLIALLEAVQQGKIKLDGQVRASDLNQSLINFYVKVQTNLDEFLTEITKLKTSYLACNAEEKEAYYYKIRQQYRAEDKTTLSAAAMFLFLNKTCFRGLYRVGPNGFNVPYGHYKSPSIFTEEHLRHVSELIQNVIFTTRPFLESLQTIQPDDFVYLDPPYAPENSTSFVGYTAKGFPVEMHRALFDRCNNLECAFLLSNSYVPLVKDAFPSDQFKVDTVTCRRRINSKKPGSHTEEVLISKRVCNEQALS